MKDRDPIRVLVAARALLRSRRSQHLMPTAILKPERVLSPAQTQSFERLFDALNKHRDDDDDDDGPLPAPIRIRP